MMSETAAKQNHNGRKHHIILYITTALLAIGAPWNANLAGDEQDVQMRLGLILSALLAALAGILTNRPRLLEKQVQERNEELQIFNKAAVGRELRMIELKKEINNLCRHLGKPKMYFSLIAELDQT